MKVLIVDDSRAMRSIMKKALAFAGLEGEGVFEACDGREALDLVEREGPELILSDVNMPVMTGDTLLDELRERGRLEASRMVMVTSAAGTRAAIDLVRRGATKVVRKPFDPLSLHGHLLELLPAPEPEPIAEEDLVEDEPISEPPPPDAHALAPAIHEAAFAALQRTLEECLAEPSERDESAVPEHRILLASSIDIDAPFRAEISLVCNYDVATRLAQQLTGDPPGEDDVARIDAVAELVNIVAGQLVDRVSEAGVEPGTFGLPRSGVAAPGDVGPEVWPCARLQGNDAVYLRLVPRTWEAM